MAYRSKSSFVPNLLVIFMLSSLAFLSQTGSATTISKPSTADIISSLFQTHDDNLTMEDILVPISNEVVSPVFRNITHPYPPVYADNKFGKPVPTNSWISNLFYPSVQDLAPTISDPYILRLLDDYGGNPGLSIRQPSDKVYGSYPAMNDVPPTEVGYMINSPIVDLRYTCAEWANVRPRPLVTSWDHFSANVRLQQPGRQGFIEFPIVRGMPYITAIYNGLTPQLFTQHAMIKIEADTQTEEQDIYSGFKFKITMNDSPTSKFVIYVLGDQPLTFHKVGTSNLVSKQPYHGVIRIAKLPSSSSTAAEAILDKSRYTWPVGGVVSAQSNGQAATYSIHWKSKGSNSSSSNDASSLLMYAYPHHLESFASNSIQRTTLTLPSSTKGDMTAVVGDFWTLVENEPSRIEWLPLRPQPEPSTINEIMDALAKDVARNYTAETFLGDNYFSGKGLQKYAMLALLLNRPDETGLRNPELAHQSLEKLKAVFLPYLKNAQQDPFFYDNVYKGIVARNGLPTSFGGTGDPNAEFGHSYYNDHHYHQGYLIVTAAIIHYLDPEWESGAIRSWTETLIRDVNTPVETDSYFAPFRSWDWFAGHSWAGGIKIDGALDGRDQESVPESVNFYWGVKLWGLATQNTALCRLASLQLAITKRTTYNYFWMLDNNQNRPPPIVKNKVIGIFFEQKTDYTTYFGRYLEFIHGIQQLPMTPVLADDIRTPEFVKQEWDQILSKIAPEVQSSWAGVLYLNYALINPSMAYKKLRNVDLDDGQTRSYSLYLASTRPQFTRIGYLEQETKSRNRQATTFNTAHQAFRSRVLKSIRRLNSTNNNHDDRYNGY